MHTPLEMLGWETVTDDYIFLKPIMDSMGMSMDEQSLPASYEPLSGYSEEYKNKYAEPGFADQVYKKTDFENLMVARGVKQQSSLKQKTEELRRLLDEQKN